MRRARPPASASTAPTGWAPIRSASCWCSARAPAGPPPSMRARRADAVGEPGAGAGAPTRSGASKASILRKTGGTRADRGAARGDAADDGSRRGHLPRRAPRWSRRRTRSASCRSAPRRSRLDDHSRAFNTQLIAALELGFMLDVAETIVQCALAARGVARRPSAQRFPRPRRPEIPRAFAGVRRAGTGGREVAYLPVTITRWPPGEAGLRRASDRWRTR